MSAAAPAMMGAVEQLHQALADLDPYAQHMRAALALCRDRGLPFDVAYPRALASLPRLKADATETQRAERAEWTEMLRTDEIRAVFADNYSSGAPERGSAPRRAAQAA